jgi:hypothetical protein
LLLFDLLAQIVLTDTKPRGHFSHEMTALRSLLDRFDLEFSGKPLLWPVTAFYASGLKLRSAYISRIDPTLPIGAQS